MHTVFENISQRIVSTYRRQMTRFAPVIPEALSADEQEAMEISQKELHGFFSAFYERMYEQPDAFGLPLTPDVCIVEGDGKQKKQDVTKGRGSDCREVSLT